LQLAAKTARSGFASSKYAIKDIEERFKVYKEITAAIPTKALTF
jgi:hypothetical protein